MSDNNKEQLPKLLRLIYTVSIFVCPGSFLCLKFLNSKELLPWLDPKFIPYFGIPLLIIFFASCLFGSRGLINLITTLYDRYKKLSDIERRYKDTLDKD